MKLVSVFSCMLATFGVFCNASQSYAQHATAKIEPAFVVKAHFEAASVGVGEPLNVHIGFDSIGGKAVSLQVGAATDWCVFDVMQGSKRLGSWSQNIRSVYLSGQGVVLETIVLPSDKDLVVQIPSFMTQLPVGEYKLRLRTHIRNNSSHPVATMDMDTPSSMQDDVTEVPFTIQPLNDALLKARVKQLFEAIEKEEDTPKTRAMACELASLPAAQARGAWRSLLLDKNIPGTKRSLIASAFSTEPTKPMAETLIYVQYSDPIRDEAGNMLTLKDMINGMALYGGQEGVREYVQEEFRRHANSPYDTSLMMEGMH